MTTTREKFRGCILGLACGDAIGYPAETEAGHPTSSLPYDKVSFERRGRS